MDTHAFGFLKDGPVHPLGNSIHLWRIRYGNFMRNHMITNGLHEPLQSAYKAGHSTETALLRVHNDVFVNMDNHSATVLVLLDLSAAFDTIDHSVLFDRMENIIGIEGTALNWFRSYLGGRSQRIQIGDVISLISVLLLFGVPQGSVLGPLLFLIYMLPLGEIIRGYGFRLHIYADDTQVYLAVRHETEDIQTVQLQLCLKDIHQWMSSNFLKLNSGKTEVLVIGTYQQLAKLNIQSLNVAGVQVNLQQKPVRNLGVMFDRNMTMSDQVKSLVRSVSYHTRNISRIRRHLTIDSTKKLVNSLVTSRLDYCNSLLVGVADGLLQRLQCAQDWAARTVLQLPRSVEAPLHELHWLPVSSRIDYKLAVSDHCLILCSLSHTKIPRPRKTVSIRKWRTIDIPAFASDVGDRLALVPISADSSQLLSSLSTIFTDVLDAHAPQSFKDLVIRPQQLWYTDELRAGKKSRRKSEQKW